MNSLTQRGKQVVDSFRRLDPRWRRYVLPEMARTDPAAWSRFRDQGEAKLRDAAREQGLDWDRLTDEQRQDFIEDFLDGRNG